MRSLKREATQRNQNAYDGEWIENVEVPFWRLFSLAMRRRIF